VKSEEVNGKKFSFELKDGGEKAAKVLLNYLTRFYLTKGKNGLNIGITSMQTLKKGDWNVRPRHKGTERMISRLSSTGKKLL